MKLEGSLDAFSLPDVFQLLSLTKKTGGLHLSNGQVTGVVHFTGGAISAAVSDESRQGLARRLVGMAVVDDAALRRAVVEAAGDGSGVARVLLEAGAVDRDTLRRLAAEHTVDAVFDLLRWPEGDFAFGVDEVNPDDVGLSLAADEVVRDATARRDTWESVSRVIPSPDVVLTAPVVLADDPAVTRAEWALLALIDGKRTVGELVDLSGAGQYAVVAALASLVQRGLLALHDEDLPDHVTLVRRRQALLTTLEGSARLEPTAEPAQPTGAPAQPTGAPAQPTGAPATSTARADPTGQIAIVAPLVSEALTAAPPHPAAGTATRGAVAPPAPVQQPPASGPLAPAASVAPVPGGGAHQPADVVPPRPEPFLPRRTVEHPEPAATPRPAGPMSSPGAGRPAAPAGLAQAAPSAAAQALIERDPSVNRSLLLRLIAGVRGL